MDGTLPVGTIESIPWVEGQVPQPPASLGPAAGTKTLAPIYWSPHHLLWTMHPVSLPLLFPLP